MKQKVEAETKRIRPVRHSDFRLARPVGNWCRVGGKKIPALKFGRIDVPLAVDNRAYCTAIEDQGANPWCAAYTAAAFAENVLWRRTGRIRQVEVEPIYTWAKAHDGFRDDGTTLECALGGLLATAKDVFDGKLCKVRTVGSGLLYPDVDDVMAAVHRFGCFLAGFAITDEWYEQRGGHYVISGGRGQSLGGHAVLVCGYDEKGVWIENSWGADWGQRGFAKLTWEAFRKQFFAGAVLTNCLDGFR